MALHIKRSREHVLRAGAAQAVITPPVGVFMAGWSRRLLPDNRARYVHDDLMSKALVVERAGQAWAIVANDLTAVDPVTTAQVREGIADQTDLRRESILLCGTHTHSGPVVLPIACVLSQAEMEQRSMKADGSKPAATPGAGMAASCCYAGQVDEKWKAFFVDQAIRAGVQAWRSMRPAEAALGEADVSGVASSRRVRLSDGTWGDPRIPPRPGVSVVSRTQIDPLVRVLQIREHGSGAPLAAVVNYGCHPWVFSGSGISAELAGTTASKVAARWQPPGATAPVVLYLTGPEGDVTTVWNTDVEHLWNVRPGEDAEDSRRRREALFWSELDRLSSRLADGALTAMDSAGPWDSDPTVRSAIERFSVPLKAGYDRPPEVILADWQRAAPPSEHRTELQALRLGPLAILGLPGEPFASIGRAIRESSPLGNLLIAALANDCGEIVYVAERASYDLGGYEMESFPVAPGAGEIIVERARDILTALSS